LKVLEIKVNINSHAKLNLKFKLDYEVDLNDNQFADVGNLINIAKSAMELRRQAVQAADQIKKELNQNKNETTTQNSK